MLRDAFLCLCGVVIVVAFLIGPFAMGQETERLDFVCVAQLVLLVITLITALFMGQTLLALLITSSAVLHLYLAMYTNTQEHTHSGE